VLVSFARKMLLDLNVAHGSEGAGTGCAGSAEGRSLAYKMVAERDNQIFTRERSSAYIVLANARVWASEGWQVKIIDGDGKEFGPAEFEDFVSAKHKTPVRAIAEALTTP
jgi:hypothetical protein